MYLCLLILCSGCQFGLADLQSALRVLSSLGEKPFTAAIVDNVALGREDMPPPTRSAKTAAFYDLAELRKAKF